MLTAGGFVATLLFPPLLGRLRLTAKHAPAMGASAIVLSVFLLFAFIETRADFPIEGMVAFVIGMLGFAAVLFADHLRRL
jgi:UDP-N-acetylmuramyl pentapeptide phosphotransferase/UDP-N-acetylglucosamine-1-phosphate transferase